LPSRVFRARHFTICRAHLRENVYHQMRTTSGNLRV
jgi:hypothetical protein